MFNVQNLSIKASGGVTAQLGQNDALAALAQQPGMAWVNQLANDPAFANSIEWQRVQEEHKKWAESQTSLGPVASVIVSVVVGVATAGAGSAAVGTATTATSTGTGIAGAMGLSATTTTIASAAMQAGITAIASQATISFVNNEGNLGKVFDELGSSQSVKNILTAMVTAGVIEGLSVEGVLPDNLRTATNGKALFTDQLQRQMLNGVASSVVRSAINGTSLEDELGSAIATALLNTVAAQGANAIGDLKKDGTFNVYGQQVAHAILGCVVGAGRASAGTGGGGSAGCAAGAIGAVVGELTAKAVNPTADPKLAEQTLQAANLMSGVIGALVGGNASASYIAASAGVNAAENNFLNHADWLQLNTLRIKASSPGGLTATESEQLIALERADQLSDGLLAKARSGQPLSADDKINLGVYLDRYRLLNGDAATVQLLTNGSPTANASNYSYPYGGTDEQKLAYMRQLRENEGPFNAYLGRDKSANEQNFNQALIKAGQPLNVTNNEASLPTSVETHKYDALFAALQNSPILAAGTYTIGTAAGADSQKVAVATQLASLISDSLGSFVVSRVDITPSLGQTVPPVVKGDVTRDGAINILMAEHAPQGQIPLTQAAAEAIIQATQPPNTKIRAAGAGAPGSDLIYEGSVGTSVQVKTASNPDNFESAVKGDLRSVQPSPVIAVQVPEGISSNQLMGKLLNNFKSSETTGKLIFVVDQNGKILIPLQPFPVKEK
ncbi:hypothetical protein ABIC90_001736 [Variovorax boronicumulans]